MTIESRNSRKLQPDDWSIGRTHCAKRTLSTRNEERCNFSWISWRSSSSLPLDFPPPPVLPSCRAFVPVLYLPSPFSPLDSGGVFVSPTRGQSPRSQARSESSQSELKPASRCAGCILCIPLGSRPHPASHVGLCSTSCARVLPSLLFLSLSLSLYLSLPLIAHSLHVLSVCLVGSRSFFHSLVSFSYFGARCNRAFSMKIYGFLSEESSPAIVLPDAADDRNFASETRRRTISRITRSRSGFSGARRQASCAR